MHPLLIEVALEASVGVIGDASPAAVQGGALAFTAGNCGNPNQHQEHSVHQHSETESYTSTVN